MLMFSRMDHGEASEGECQLVSSASTIATGPIDVSVIVPAFNATDTIERNLDSIRSQTLPSIEVIVVDDGSEDNTATIALYKMRTFQVSDINDAYTQGNYGAVRLITIGIAFALCLPYTMLTTTDAGAILTIMVFLLFKADETFADFLYGVDQRGMRMDYIGRSQIARGILSLGSFSAGLVLAGSLPVAIGCMFVGCAMVTLLYDLPHARRFDVLRPRIYGRTALIMLLNGLPAVLALVANIAVVSMSRQILGMVCGDEALGIYASISTPAVLMQAAVGYLYTPMVGRLAEAWDTADPHALFRFLGKMILVVTGALIACSGVLIATGPWLLTLVFGDSITSSLWIFPWSILGTAFIALISLAMDVLIVFRRAKAALLSCTVAFCVAAITAAPSIDAFGINGINLSISLAYLIGVAIGVLFIVRAVIRCGHSPSDPTQLTA